MQHPNTTHSAACSQSYLHHQAHLQYNHASHYNALACPLMLHKLAQGAPTQTPCRGQCRALQQQSFTCTRLSAVAVSTLAAQAGRHLPPLCCCCCCCRCPSSPALVIIILPAVVEVVLDLGVVRWAAGRGQGLLFGVSGMCRRPGQEVAAWWANVTAVLAALGWLRARLLNALLLHVRVTPAC